MKKYTIINEGKRETRIDCREKDVPGILYRFEDRNGKDVLKIKTNLKGLSNDDINGIVKKGWVLMGIKEVSSDTVHRAWMQVYNICGHK